MTSANGAQFCKTAKNLLEEFDRDETLEPNMQLFSDGKTQLAPALLNGDERNIIGGFENCEALLVDERQS